MKSKTALTLLVLVLVAAGWYALQMRPDIPVIGILHPSGGQVPAVVGFQEKLGEFGYEDGVSVTYLYDGPTGAGTKLSERADDFIANGATLIYAVSTPATKAALKAAQGSDVVVVFGPVNDPVGAGFVDSLRAPGGNVTGVTLAPSTAKRFAWFKEFSPAVTRILAPFNPSDGSATTSLDRVKAHVSSLDLELLPMAVQNPDEVQALFADLPKEIDAVFLPRDSMISSLVDDIIAVTIERKLPLSVSSSGGVERGALFSYGVQLEDVGSTAARLTHEILSGTDPARIPVAIQDSNLFINTDTARMIGLDLSPALLSQAHALLP